VVKVSYEEIKTDKEVRKGMLREIVDLLANGKVKIIRRPPGVCGITSTWAHKDKTAWKAGSEVHSVKSRLCPRGYEQRAGVEGKDFNPDKVEAPTPSSETLFMALALQVNRDMYCNVIDESSAFSNTPLADNVYMEFPDGMRNTPNKDFILQLVNSINGTRQAANNYYNLRSKAFLLEEGFKVSTVDPCFFWKWINDKHLVFVLLWTDDFRVCADRESDLAALTKRFTERRTCVVQPGGEKYLGLIIKHDRKNGTIDVSAEEKVRDLLARFGMQNCNPSSTPAIPRSKLSKAPEYVDVEAQQFDLPSCAASCLWIARFCRFEILHQARELMRHMQNWSSEHVQAAKHLLRYLKGTEAMTLTLHRGQPHFIRLAAYSDSDWAGCPETSHSPMCSTSGNVLYLVQIGAIYAQSVTQKTVALSTAEAETISACECTKRVRAGREFFTEIGFPQPEPSEIKEDNEACIAMSKSILTSSKSRHMKIKHHYVRSQVAEGEVKLVPCPTSEMVADILTKNLERPQFVKLRDILLGKAPGLY